MAHILVTGANGFIGSHLVRRLLELKKEQNWEEDILCMVRSTSDISALKGLDIKLITGDVREPGTLVNAVKGAAYIYHLGAELFTISRKRFMDVIAKGTENMLNAAVQHGGGTLKRFLLVSSQAAAGPSDSKTPITEERTPPPGVSWYAEAKLEAERIAKTYMDRLPITIVRPCSVYGERDKAFYATFKSVEMRIHALTGFRKRYTGMVYVKDLVEGFIAASRSPRSIGETYFLSNVDSYSVGQVNKAMAKAMGKPWGLSIPFPLFIFRIIGVFMELFYLFFRIEPIPTRDKVRDMSQVYWICSPAKAKDHLGWEAKYSLLDGMKFTTRFYKDDDYSKKKMPLETPGLLWLKYIILSTVFGGILEALGAYGKLYAFNPAWLVWIVIPVFWGFIMGTAAKIIRTCSIVVQFLAGFVIVMGAELLNHFFLHIWQFTDGSFLGISNTFGQAAVNGAVGGLMVIIANSAMCGFYKRMLRLG